MGRIKLNLSFSLPKTKKGKLELKTEYGDVKIKQYSKVTYLGDELDKSLSGEAMVLKVIIRLMAGLNSFTGKIDI